MSLPGCEHQNPSGAKFCLECGRALAVACPQCRTRLPLDAKFCLECGAALHDLPREPTDPSAVEGASLALSLPGGDERRQITVLFCDLVGSTEMAARLDPEEWQAIVRTHHERAGEVVARHGGHVAQILGDGLLAYFGWPQGFDDAAERGVRTGLSLVEAASGAATGMDLAVRVGIHTGTVVVGAIGSGDHSEILALGSVPNVAARVQGVAEPGSVVVTAATQRLVAGIFLVEDQGPRRLKGVPESIRTYRVLRQSGVGSRLDAAVGCLSPFVGRHLELATLIDRWERACGGEGQNVIVLGEPGVGKSRLVYQLRDHLASLPHTWIECGATPYTASTPFHPFVVLLTQALRFSMADSVDRKLAKLEHGLASFASPETVSLLADLLGLPPPIALEGAPELKRRKVIDLLSRWGMTLAEEQPLVGLFEDLHWCDASSLELLGRLIAQSPSARVLLLATARPEFSPPSPTRGNLTILPLSRLPPAQAREMVAALTQGDLSEKVREALVERAGGVPLYLEELTKALVEPGVDGTAEAIPLTLADSLLARLDRLSTAKQVAQQAAVLGREFSYSLLKDTAGLDEAGLRLGLRRLTRAEIVFARGEPPEATYLFKHALLHEAAYESLPKRTRQELHGRVVDVLLSKLPERAASQPGVVARHAEAAGRTDDAIRYAQAAGDQARARWALPEAIRHFRHAIALLSTRPAGQERDAREVSLQLALGATLAAARGYAHPEVEAAYERARALCDAANDPRRLGSASIGLAIFYFTRGEVERGREIAARVLATAQRTDDMDLTLRAHVDVAMPEFYQGQFASSLAHCEAAQVLYDQTRHRHAVSEIATDPGVAALAFGAWNLWVLGWPDQALARARGAVELAQRLEHPFSLGLALFHETVVHWMRRDTPLQLERSAKLAALGTGLGFPLWAAVGDTWHAAARVRCGEVGAVDDVAAAIERTSETGTRAAAPGLFVLLAESCLAAGRLADADGALDLGFALSQGTGQPLFDAELHRLRGEVALARGDGPSEVERSLGQSVAVARSQGAKSLELRAVSSLARLRRAEGRPKEGESLLAPLYAWFTEGADCDDWITARALLVDGVAGVNE